MAISTKMFSISKAVDGWVALVSNRWIRNPLLSHRPLCFRYFLGIFFFLSLALSPGFPEVPDSGIRFPPDMPRNAGSQRSMRRERHTLQAAFIVSSIADSSFLSPEVSRVLSSLGILLCSLTWSRRIELKQTLQSRTNNWTREAQWNNDDRT